MFWREWRGDGHVAALTIAGLGPLEALFGAVRPFVKAVIDAGFLPGTSRKNRSGPGAGTTRR